MNLVTLENVGKQFSERKLLDSVDLLINEGDRIGLIGVNGSGKTTLLRIIAGLEPVDSGNVVVWGGTTLRYLPQQPELDGSLTVLDHLFQSDEPAMRLLRAYERASLSLQQHPDDPVLQQRFLDLTAEMDRTRGWEAEAKAKTILTRLGITEFSSPVAQLSGGQRKRVALAQGLINPSDLLILDEPTNHIDADTVAWLEEYLTTVPGALLMVTHDRYFLDRVVNRIVELDRRKLANYPGNYSKYLEQRTARHEQLAAAEAAHQNRLRQELEWLRRGAQARSTKQKARKQRIAELQQLSYDRGEQRVALALATRRLGKKVLAVSGLSKSYGDELLFHDVDFHLEPGDRVGIIGPNGAGKSTFLDILAGKTAPDSGVVTWGETVHLGYYDQESAALPGDQRIIDYIESLAPLVRTAAGDRVDAAQMLGWFLFSRPEQRAYIGDLSGGEQRRLYLLRTLLHQPNVIMLDEPTNDLDVQTLTVLEEFLDHFQGALIVVSHDRYFLDRNVDFLVHFGETAVSGRYPAPFSSYQQLRREAEKEAAARQTAAASRPPAREAAQPPATGARRLSWREKQELQQLEEEIATLEAEKEAVAAAINASGDDYLRLQELAARLEETDAVLEQKMERWLELAALAGPN
jgi:ABC transport system ATP-binding/permease protein